MRLGLLGTLPAHYKEGLHHFWLIGLRFDRTLIICRTDMTWLDFSLLLLPVWASWSVSLPRRTYGKKQGFFGLYPTSVLQVQGFLQTLARPNCAFSNCVALRIKTRDEHVITFPHPPRAVRCSLCPMINPQRLTKTKSLTTATQFCR